MKPNQNWERVSRQFARYLSASQSDFEAAIQKAIHRISYLVSLGRVDLDVLGVVVLSEGSGGERVEKAIVLEQSTDVCNHE